MKINHNNKTIFVYRVLFINDSDRHKCMHNDKSNIVESIELAKFQKVNSYAQI